MNPIQPKSPVKPKFGKNKGDNSLATLKDVNLVIAGKQDAEVINVIQSLNSYPDFQLVNLGGNYTFNSGTTAANNTLKSYKVKSICEYPDPFFATGIVARFMGIMVVSYPINSTIYPTNMLMPKSLTGGVQTWGSGPIEEATALIAQPLSTSFKFYDAGLNDEYYDVTDAEISVTLDPFGTDIPGIMTYQFIFIPTEPIPAPGYFPIPTGMISIEYEFTLPEDCKIVYYKNATQFL
jgi:hypothetical protein